MALKVGDIYTGVRALLNDQDDAVFTNTVLKPYFDMAYEELRQECEDSNIPITNKTSAAITINQGVYDIGGPTGPALPNDLIEPLECWEIPAGTNDDYMRMRQLNFLPKTSVLTAYLEVWQWADGYIHFLGANGVIQVKIDYVANAFANAVDENSLIRTQNAVNYLKFKTAAYASMFIGENESRAQVCNDQADLAMARFLNISIKNQQAITTRRRPFMGSYKFRGMLYGR